VPLGAAGIWIFAGLGLIGSLVAFLLSFMPPSQIAVGSPTVYVAILIAGDVICVGIPVMIYAVRKSSWKTAEGSADFEPFGRENKVSQAAAISAHTKPALP
jgi:hypothetical protein